jgi:hypothetical protein
MLKELLVKLGCQKRNNVNLDKNLTVLTHEFAYS